MADALPPTISKGEPLTYTKRPFLGILRVNKVIALYNAITKLRVKVVTVLSPSTTPANDLQTSSSPDFTWDARGALLTIPIPQQQPNQGWFWIPGAHNYNPALTYADQQLVYVPASSTAVTTGYIDPDTLDNVKSVAGIWVALKAVAPVVISGTTYYRIPHLPYPTDDDLDASNNYWALVSQSPQCV